jgi:uncharacterized integral membrane protein (TIGR00697 family)
VIKDKQLDTNFKPDVLIGIYVFCIITSELMGSKTFPLFQIFGFSLTGSIGMFLIPWIFSINDIFAEVFGLKRAKNLAKISILIVFLLILLSLLAISLPPSARYLSMNDAYRQIFSQSIRISIASIIAITVSNFTDINIFWKLKQKLSRYGLWFRNNLSNHLAILLDTVVFMTLAFYSLDKPFSNNLTFLLGIIIPYWLLKAFMSSISTPFVYWGIKWLKSTK